MRRNKLEMNIAILRVCDVKPLKITRVMYGSNINNAMLKPMLEHLVTKGLIRKLDIVRIVGHQKTGQKGTLYKTTKEGQNVLALYKKLTEVLL